MTPQHSTSTLPRKAIMVLLWSSLYPSLLAACRSPPCPRGREAACTGIVRGLARLVLLFSSLSQHSDLGLAIRDPAGGCGSLELRRLSRKLDVSSYAIEAGALGETLERCATRNSCIVSGNNES